MIHLIILSHVRHQCVRVFTICEGDQICKALCVALLIHKMQRKVLYIFKRIEANTRVHAPRTITNY